MFSYFLLVAYFLQALPVVCSFQNITVDDSGPSIAYFPLSNWAVSSGNPLDYGGSHRSTHDSSAFANFTFEGVGVYYMSPRWPYHVTTTVSLDSGPPVLLDLTDYSQPSDQNASETVQSAVIWGISGLANIQHTLLISVGSGQLSAVVDGLIYTAFDSTDVSPARRSSAVPTSLPSSSSSTTSVAIASTSKKSSSHTLPIVVGTVFGFLGLTFFSFAIWYHIRHRKGSTSQTDDEI